MKDRRRRRTITERQQGVRARVVKGLPAAAHRRSGPAAACSIARPSAVSLVACGSPTPPFWRATSLSFFGQRLLVGRCRAACGRARSRRPSPLRRSIDSDQLYSIARAKPIRPGAADLRGYDVDGGQTTKWPAWFAPARLHRIHSRHFISDSASICEHSYAQSGIAHHRLRRGFGKSDPPDESIVKQCEPRRRLRHGVQKGYSGQNTRHHER